MLLRFRIYWITLGALLLSIAFFVNRFRNPNEKIYITFGKSVFEVSLAGLLAFFFPPLLIAYCILWLSQFVSKNQVVRVTFSVFANLLISRLAVWALELILILGTLAMGLVSTTVAENWRKNVNRMRNQPI
jgi:hypothetical protein